MSDREKMKIYVPEAICRQIYYDVEMFEVSRKDKNNPSRPKPNINDFLSRLICGYYEMFLHESNTMLLKVNNILDQYKIEEEQREKIARTIIENIFIPFLSPTKEKSPSHLSYKPTDTTSSILDDIDSANNKRSNELSLQQYLGRMIISYCSKPFSEREKIVFKENYEQLKKACNDHRQVSFSLIHDRNVRHTVMPYALAVGTEKMYNYLLCEEKDKYYVPIMRTYRLNRICGIIYTTRTFEVDENVRKHCERALQLSPQYAINSDEEICVCLSDRGEIDYRRIYHGRPQVDYIEDADGKHYYHFKCSADQVFHYFRRFDCDKAIIISPQELRDRMKDFHREVLESYT